MAVKPVVYDDSTKKHRPLGSGEKMDGLSASSIISSQSGNLITTGSDGLAYATGSGIIDPAADNLLEATSGGKVKMDVDRLAEWLDGHPNDAKTISEAIKVVSGDSGNVITKGSDKGAYLSASSLASILGGLTDAQRQALAAALADGQTITASGGKLTVDPTNAPKAKLQAINAALRKSGGGLALDSSTGKLYVDFGSMDPATLSALVAQIIQEHGGLAQDGDGKLYVDFEEMDDTKFRRMMQGFIDKQTIKSAGGGNHFYVDGSNANVHGDDDPKLRANPGSPSDPFKTIQKCVDYITQVYKFADVNTYINCQNISQTSMLSLPSFDRTTAEITIRSAAFTAATARGSVDSTSTGYDIDISRAPTAGSRYAVDCTGTGVWNLRNFNGYCTDESLGSSGGHLAALHVGDYATVDISYCKFKTKRSSAHPELRSLTTGEHVVYISNYGYLEVGPHCTVIGDDLDADPTVIDSGDNAGTYHRELNGMTISGTGTVRINDTRDDKKLVFSGDFDSIVYCTSYIVRNRAYMGAADASAVANANYRFLFEYGGRGNINEAGLIDSTHNDSSATDTWLGTASTNQDTTSRISHVQTSTYSWYD